MIRKILVGMIVCTALARIGVTQDKGPLTPEIRAKCLSVLRAALRSDEFWPSIHAAEALTLAGLGAEVREFLEPRLEEETDDQHRCGIARELVRAGDREKSQVMLDILRDNDSDGRTHAAESLYKVGWIGDATPLMRAFRAGDDMRLRLMAAAAIAKHGQGADRDDALRFLRNRMASENDPELLRVTAWILGRVGEERDRGLIRARLGDAKDALTRAYLDHALAALGDPDGKAATVRNLESDDAAIRTYAAVFAGEAGIFEARPLLVRQLDDENLDARVRAAQALIVLAQ